MKTPHKYADVIKAWADGAEVQYWDNLNTWQTQTTPSFDPWLKWRVKPEPVEDIILFAHVAVVDDGGFKNHHFGWVGNANHGNLQLTFDGASGHLKKADVLWCDII